MKWNREDQAAQNAHGECNAADPEWTGEQRTLGRDSDRYGKRRNQDVERVTTDAGHRLYSGFQFSSTTLYCAFSLFSRFVRAISVAFIGCGVLHTVPPRASRGWFARTIWENARCG